eukprot:4056386-Lingulodinium_polyedra.AAC.1
MRSKRPSAAATASKSHARARHARAGKLSRMNYAIVRFASRCGNAHSIRPHRRVTFFKRCAHSI